MNENTRNLLLVTAAVVLTTSMISAGTMISNQVYAQAGPGTNTQTCNLSGTENGLGSLGQTCNQEAGMCIIGGTVENGDLTGTIAESDCS
jgi:hypothetical protein